MKEYFVLATNEHEYIAENNHMTQCIGEAKVFSTFKDAETAAKNILEHYVIYNLNILSIKTKVLKRYAKRMQIICLDKE